MANKFKYGADRLEPNSLFKGDWSIDISDNNTGGGPSIDSGLYNGADIPDGGYVVYSPGKVCAAINDKHLLSHIEHLGGDSSNVPAALLWALSNSEVVILASEFNTIVTEGLVLHIDPNSISSFVDSEPTINFISDPTQEHARGEFGQYYNLVPIFETNGLVPYTLSMEIKGNIPGNCSVYMQNGSYSKYSFVGHSVNLTTEWQRFSFENLTPAGPTAAWLNNTPNDHRAMLATYTGYGSGRTPTVRNIQIEHGPSATAFVEGERLQNTVLHGLGPNNHTVLLNNNVAILNQYDNNYLSFDGIDDYATFSSEAAFNSGGGTDFTFEVWFKMRTLPTGTYGKDGHIWGGENGNDLVLYLAPNDGEGSRGNMVFDDARYHENHYSNHKFQADTWAHWVICGDGTNNTLTHYVNGSLDRENSPVSASQVSRPWGGTRFAYDARWKTYSTLDLGIARQYDRMLTDKEVDQNFNAQRSRFGL